MNRGPPGLGTSAPSAASQALPTLPGATRRLNVGDAQSSSSAALPMATSGVRRNSVEKLLPKIHGGELPTHSLGWSAQSGMPVADAAPTAPPLSQAALLPHSHHNGAAHEDDHDHDAALEILAGLSWDEQEDGKDPLDSSRPDMCINMGRLALEAILRDFTFVITPKVWGSFGAEESSAQDTAVSNAAAPAQRQLSEAEEAERAKKQKDEERKKAAAERASLAAAKQAAAMKEAERIKAGKQRPKELSPLLVLERQRALERERKKEEMRSLKRAKQLEKERASEANERNLMAQEEWYQERVKWAKNWGGREGSWKTVRVFISSTFTDMHGERDSMTRSVFPVLNNMCKSRRVRVVPVDLRWGLTAEDTSDTGLGAMEHCLLEVDHSRPYFIVLHGDRYGWIPPNYRLSDREEFEWARHFEPEHSITDMEIQYGFLRKPFQPVYAFLYRRDPSFLAEIPPTAPERKIFAFDYEGDDVVLERRNKLRIDMEAHQFCKTSTYSCKYGGKDDEGKPHVTSLAAFEQRCLDDLWEAIKKEFPPPKPPPSDLAYERSFHMHFVDDRSRGFIGRQPLVNELFQFAEDDSKVDTLPLVIVGQPGSGKTSLVTAFAKQFMEARPKVFTIVHVVSASPSSTDIRELLLRLCREMVERFRMVDWTEDELDEYQAVKEAFFSTLTRAGDLARKEGTHLLIIIDAVNQLSQYNGAWTLDWFPSYSPPGVRVILTSSPDAECMNALAKRDPRPPQTEVPALTIPERQEIVKQQLAEYRKKLTGAQLRLLLDKKESSKPLFLLTACEELRLQAQYGMGGGGVDEKIRDLPGEIPALLDVVLERVERDLAAWAKTSAAQALLPEPVAETDKHLRPGTASEALTGREGETPGKARLRGRRGSGGMRDDDEDEVGGSKEDPDRIFNDDLTDPDLIGRQVVKKALTLIECSRHGLQESELLELLAPRGKRMLPPIVWARLYRSLELYLHPLGEEENGMLGFFSQQMVHAVRKRYLQNNRLREAEVCNRLAAYFMSKADPTFDGMFLGENKRYIEDLTYYHVRALQIDTIKRILGSLIFIERRARRGAGQMERLLRDYHMTREEIRILKISLLKALMSRDDFNKFSRAALLSWIGEYMVFVGSHHTQLTSYPNLTFQYALNQPDISGPHAEAVSILQSSLAKVVERMDRREKRAVDRAEAAIWSLLCQQYQLVLHAAIAPQLLAASSQAALVPGPPTPAPTSPRSKSSLAAASTTTRASVAPRSSSVAGNKAADAPVTVPLPSTGPDPLPALKGITDPAEWIAVCAKEFGVPKPSMVGLIASFMNGAFAIPGMGRVTSNELGNASGMAMETLVNLFSTTLQTYIVNKQAEDQAELGDAAVPIAQSTSTRSIVYMTREESSNLGLSWSRLKHIRAALVEDLLTLSLGVTIDMVPRRYLEWVNKPQRNRIVADFAGLHSQVTCIALSPDSSNIALGFKSAYVHVIDAGTGEVLRELVTHGHTEGVTCLSFSGDGLRLASGSHDTQIIIWDSLTGTRLASFTAHTGSVTSAIWLDGEISQPAGAGRQDNAGGAGAKKTRRRMNRTLVSASMEGDIRISAEKNRMARSNLETSELHDMKYELIWSKDFMASPVLALAHNAYTDTLVGGHGDGDITVWDAHAPNLGLIELFKFKAHKFCSVMSVDFSPDGVLLASGGADGVMRIWRRHVVGADLVWKEEPSTQGDKTSGGHSNQVTATHFSPDGTKILTCSLDKKLLLWDVESGTEILSMSGHADAVYAATFLGNDNRVVSASYDKTVKFWDVGGVDDRRSSAPIKRANLGAAAGGRASNLRSNLNDTGGRGRRQFGRKMFGMRHGLAQENEAAPHAPAGAHSDRVLTAIVSRDGTTAVTGAADKEIKVWDIAKGEEKCVLLGHTASVTAVCLTNDHRWLFSGDADGTLMIWDGTTFDHIFTISAHPAGISCITYAIIVEPPDPGVVSKGTIVFTGATDGRVRAWNADTGGLWELQPPEPDFGPLHNNGIKALQFVCVTQTSVPSSSYAAPLDSGVFPEAYDIIQRLERPPRSASTGPVIETAPTAASVSQDVDALAKAGVMGRGRGRGRGALLPAVASKDGPGRGKKPGTNAAAGSLPGAQDATTDSSNKEVSHPQDMPLNPYRADRSARRPDPVVMVEGQTAAHSVPRLYTIGGDGKLLVIDIFTMQIVHEDSASAEVGLLSTAAVTPDGSRVAIATSMPAAKKPVLVSSGASMANADGAVLELPGQHSVAKEATKRKKIESETVTSDPADQKKRAEDKLKETLAKLEARKKRKEEKKAAKKMEKEKTRAAAAAARAAAVAKAGRRGSASSLPDDAPEEEFDDDDDDDDDDESESEVAPPQHEEPSKEQDVAVTHVEEDVVNDKLVCAVALSCDGTLLAAGCTERLLSILDAARPSQGPLVQFLALGEVTAVAIGPGLTPWGKTNAESCDKAGQSTNEQLGMPTPMSLGFDSPKHNFAFDSPLGVADNSSDSDSSDQEDNVGDGGASSPFASRLRRQSKLTADTWDALRFHASEVGDGNGRLGIIVAGDSTGAVFILRAIDVLRVAEAERQRKAVEQENKRRAEADAKRRHVEELRRQAEDEKKRQESLLAASRPPVEILEFPTGVSSPAVLVPRQMYSDVPLDMELAKEILKTFGVKYDELTHEELDPADSQLLLDLIGMGAQPPVQIAAHPSSPRASTAASASLPSPPISSPVRGGKPAGAGRGKAATRGGRPAASSFSSDAPIDIPPVDQEVQDRLRRGAELHEELWQKPRSLVGVFGGAGGLHDLLVPNLRRLVKRGAVAAAVMSGGMVLDGGTAAGVMDMIGTAVSSAEPKSIRLLGISPAQLVLKPGDKSNDPNSSPLEPHHTNFVLVPSSEWGGETSTMFTMAAALAEKVPTVAVLANGGMISKKEILNAVRHRIPTVVIEGSGRLADQIARAIHRREETPPEEYDSSIYIPDPEVREIVIDGELRLFNVTGHGETLCNVLLELLSSQRDRILIKQNSLLSAEL